MNKYAARCFKLGRLPAGCAYRNGSARRARAGEGALAQWAWLRAGAGTLASRRALARGGQRGEGFLPLANVRSAKNGGRRVTKMPPAAGLLAAVTKVRASLPRVLPEEKKWPRATAVAAR